MSVVMARGELVVLVELEELVSAAAVFVSPSSAAAKSAAVDVAAIVCTEKLWMVGAADAAAVFAVFAIFAAALGTAVHLLPSRVVKNAPAGRPAVDILISHVSKSLLANPVAPSRGKKKAGQNNQ